MRTFAARDIGSIQRKTGADKAETVGGHSEDDLLEPWFPFHVSPFPLSYVTLPYSTTQIVSLQGRPTERSQFCEPAHSRRFHFISLLAILYTKLFANIYLLLLRPLHPNSLYCIASSMSLAHITFLLSLNLSIYGTTDFLLYVTACTKPYHTKYVQLRSDSLAKELVAGLFLLPSQSLSTPFPPLSARRFLSMDGFFPQRA